MRDGAGRRVAVLLLSLLVIATACGGDGEAATDTTTTAPVTAAEDVDEPETTVGTTTTTAVATTAGDAEAAIREIHTRFMVELLDYDERTDDPQEFLALAEELTSGAQLQRIRDRVEALPDLDNRYAGPGYESNIVEVAVTGEFATVLDCSLDRGVTYSVDGEPIDEPGGDYEYRETLLAREDGRWFVTDFRTGGEGTCEP